MDPRYKTGGIGVFLDLRGEVNPGEQERIAHPFGCMGLNCGFFSLVSPEGDSRLRGNDGEDRNDEEDGTGEI